MLPGEGRPSEGKVLFRRRPVREENDFFNQKAPPRRGPTKETDLDRGSMPQLVSFTFACSDDGGIYKRRTNHRDYAEEIDDNRETKVDLPIDYRQVETVDDEHLYGDLGVGSVHPFSVIFLCRRKRLVVTHPKSPTLNRRR